MSDVAWCVVGLGILVLACPGYLLLWRESALSDRSIREMFREMREDLKASPGWEQKAKAFVNHSPSVLLLLFRTGLMTLFGYFVWALSGICANWCPVLNWLGRIYRDALNFILLMRGKPTLPGEPASC